MAVIGILFMYELTPSNLFYKIIKYLFVVQMIEKVLFYLYNYVYHKI